MELNSNQIQEILPHRYPFQLVDRSQILNRANGRRGEMRIRE